MTAKNEQRRSRRLMPPISALSAFDAVVRCGGFTAAAEELALTQSAVSRQVSSLEDLLGVALFEPNRRRQIVLTASGRFYSEEVRQILSQLMNATTEAIALDSRGQVLRLGIPPTFGSMWLIPRMRDFFEANPEILIEFSTRIPSQPQSRPGALHALIDFSTEAGGEAHWEKLIEFDLQMVATQDIVDSLASKNPPLNQTHLLIHMTERPRLAEMLEDPRLEKFAACPPLTFESYTMLLQAAIRGIGIALAPVEMMQGNLDARRLQPVVDWSTSGATAAYLIYDQAMRSYTPLVTFRAWLLETIRQERAAGEKNDQPG